MLTASTRLKTNVCIDHLVSFLLLIKSFCFAESSLCDFWFYEYIKRELLPVIGRSSRLVYTTCYRHTCNCICPLKIRQANLLLICVPDNVGKTVMSTCACTFKSQLRRDAHIGYSYLLSPNADSLGISRDMTVSVFTFTFVFDYTNI